MRAKAPRGKASLLGAPPLPSRSYAHEVLSESATILVKTGHSPKELMQTFRRICGALDEPSRPFDPGGIAYVVGLGHVVAHWYSDPDFRDALGQPLRLPLKGRGPCLARLIRRVFPRHDIKAVAASLARAGALRRLGRLYCPTGRYVLVTRDVTSIHIHALTSLVGMLRTVKHNISYAHDEQARLLERAAASLYVPIRAVPEIHRRIKRDMTALLWKLDGYLRSWEVKPGSEPTTHIGVGAYAYEDPTITGAGRKQVHPADARRTHRARGARRR